MRFTAVVVLIASSQAGHAFCNPPVAPDLTNEELAKDYREEFKAEFETYFADASAYIVCIDSERQQVLLELKNTSIRYERFLDHSKNWTK